MSISNLQKKIELLPEEYAAELAEFIDFLLFRESVRRSGLDEAISELNNGEYSVYHDFDAFLKEAENET